MVNVYSDVPIGSHTLAFDQPLMEDNFLYLAQTLGSNQPNKAPANTLGDHQISLGGTDGTVFEGRHLRVSLKDLGLQAYPGDGTDSVLFSAGGSLFWRNSSSSPVIMLTASLNGGNPIVGTNGATMLPGTGTTGVALQWGQVVTPGTSGAVTFPFAFNGVPFSIQLTLQRANLNSPNAIVDSNTIPTAGGFHYQTNASGAGTTLLWMAIGAR